jgi:hypothetical protein
VVAHTYNHSTGAAEVGRSRTSGHPRLHSKNLSEKERKDGWMDGWMDGWIDGQVSGWIKKRKTG